MTTRYNMYSGNHAGGPIDYSVPVGTVEGLQFTTDNLPVPSSTRFGLRVFDDVTGLEEKNIDVTKTVVIDALGRNVSDVPGPPIALAVAPSVASLIVSWSYTHNANYYEPTLFNVYVTPGTAVDYSAPAAVVSVLAMVTSYSRTVSGLTPGATYAVAVRAANGASEETNLNFVIATVRTSPPLDPIDMTIRLG